MPRIRKVARSVLVVSTLLAPQMGGLVVAQAQTPSAVEAENALPAGVSGEPLAMAVTESVPAAPAMMELIRFTFAPGASLQLPEDSPSTALVYVESGTLTARVAAPVTVTRDTVAGERIEIPAGSAFTAEAGDFFIGPAHTAVEARNAGTEPLVLLMAVIEPAAGMPGAATPVP